MTSLRDMVPSLQSKDRLFSQGEFEVIEILLLDKSVCGHSLDVRMSFRSDVT